MPGSGKVKVAIIGSQFEADIHAASFQIMPEEAEVVAVCSPTPGHPEALAARYEVPRVVHDYREILKEPEIEVYGEDGVTFADLHMGNALPTFSERGYGYAVEKAPTTRGWTWPVFEELWNYGFPQEMRHFARCVRGKEEPRATGEDGRRVMEALYAGYASAGSGRRIALPYEAPAGIVRPIDLWLGPQAERGAQ